MDVVLATIAPEQFLTTQASLPPPETSKRPGKVGDQGQGWKWLRVRRLARVELSQKIRAKARRLKLCQRPRAQRLTKARKLLPRQRSPSQSNLTPWPRRRRPPQARRLILLSPGQLAKKILPQPRLSLGFFSYSSFFLYIYVCVCVCVCVCTFLLLWQFAIVYDVSFLLINEKTLAFAL